ncbi:hypothetical protein [Streptomyces sp. NRRL B-24572]|uniref:hypothetical protein n=1 Tax=Streptomyces sp. NRRL B-24572 TaxID=1962156 RepID=UPI000A3A5D0B|nr:hypothetical protein [Streptomyces sp. NRRL B-24572]
MTSDYPIKIHILDPDEHDPDAMALTDVGVVNVDGERHLFLKPQSFYSAVRQIRKSMPDMPLEQVERLVREHVSFRDFDELLAPAVEPPTPLVDLPPLPPEPPTPFVPAQRKRGRNWAIAAALIPAFAGTWAVGYATAMNGTQSAASAQDQMPATAADDEYKAPEPFEAGDFLDFSKAGKIACHAIDSLEAECTDSDGMVMATTAATGPDSVVFTFSYGSERLGLRIFEDVDYAATWVQQDGSQAMYPHMKRWGRYVLWGTDEERLAEYMSELRSAPQKRPAALTEMGGHGVPLPPRLAALTLGTLGLASEDLSEIVFRPEQAGVTMPTLLAVRAVLGLDVGVPSPEPSGIDDIVALAAGLEASSPSDETETNIVSVSVVEPETELTPEPDPEPTPEPEPTTTQDPEPTPEADSTPTSEPAPESTPASEPTPTPESTVTPAPEPAATLTPDLEPISEPTPSEPVSDVTPSPDLDPAPYPAPTSEPNSSGGEGKRGGDEADPLELDEFEGGGLLGLPRAWVAQAG